MTDVVAADATSWQWLLDGAAQVLARRPGSGAHRRAAAFLARQSIERVVQAEVDARAGSRSKWASKFLVLGTLRPDIDARRGRMLWSEWSEICHYHAYDLVPLADEVARRIDDTRAWLQQFTDASEGAG